MRLASRAVKHSPITSTLGSGCSALRRSSGTDSGRPDQASARTGPMRASTSRSTSKVTFSRMASGWLMCTKPMALAARSPAAVSTGGPNEASICKCRMPVRNTGPSGTPKDSSARTISVFAEQPRSVLAGSFIKRLNASLSSARKTCNSNSPTSLAALATTRLDLWRRKGRSCSTPSGDGSLPRSARRSSKQSSVFRTRGKIGLPPPEIIPDNRVSSKNHGQRIQLDTCPRSAR